MLGTEGAYLGNGGTKAGSAKSEVECEVVQARQEKHATSWQQHATHATLSRKMMRQHTTSARHATLAEQVVRRRHATQDVGRQDTTTRQEQQTTRRQVRQERQPQYATHATQLNLW